MKPLRDVLREALYLANRAEPGDVEFDHVLTLLLREGVGVRFTHGDITNAWLELREGTRPNVQPRAIFGAWANVPKGSPSHVMVSGDTTRPAVAGEPAVFGALYDALEQGLRPSGFQIVFPLKDIAAGGLTETSMTAMTAEQLGEWRPS